jgi:hypothetical protein
MERENEINSTDAIEVTPEMIAAGAEEICRHLLDLLEPTDNLLNELAVSVFEAMRSVQRS